MSRLVSRILLSIFMFPLAGIFYIFVAMVSEQAWRNNSYGPDRDVMMFLSAGALTWGFVALYWCLLWRSSVQWNNSRMVWTFLGAGAALFVGGIAGAVAGGILNKSDGASFGIFVGGILAIVLWLIATVFIWRESAAERAQRVKSSTKSAITCPTCGYNLTGLSESRCPECGSKFTLDELIGLQPNAEVEIE